MKLIDAVLETLEDCGFVSDFFSSFCSEGDYKAG